MSTLFTRAGRDFGTLLRTPAALTAAIAFVAGAAAAIAMFPGEPISASTAAPAAGAEQAQPAPAAAVPQPVPANIRQQIERMLEQAQRVPVLVPSSGADVVIVKFNDYQCPPCRQTYLDFKPVIAKLQQQNPGKVQFMTKDFPLDPECNSLGGGHMAACEAAVAVRLAREKGRAEALEDWLFQNQPSLTPDMVKAGARDVGNVADFEARYQATLGLVRGDISQGLQLGVNGTPTFFMNGIRLPNFNRGEYFEVAVDWELRRVAASRKQ